MGNDGLQMGNDGLQMGNDGLQMSTSHKKTPRHDCREALDVDY
jgi:hypothetical protein